MCKYELKNPAVHQKVEAEKIAKESMCVESYQQYWELFFSNIGDEWNVISSVHKCHVPCMIYITASVCTKQKQVGVIHTTLLVLDARK